MELISGYMRDEKPRHALNALTQKTFGFDFEGWVTGGYFEGDYIPYSFIEDGRILANVSANRMRFMQNGEVKDYIQIGTVMTDEAFRRQGLAGKLLKHVVEVYENECDGIYLFGNLDSLGFYRKMGFLEGLQYRWSVKEECLPAKKPGSGFVPVKASDAVLRNKYLDDVRNCSVNSSLEQINKFGLQMFYTCAFEDLYYAEDIDCFAVYERNGDDLALNSIISRNRVYLPVILERLGGDYKTCTLGFTPLEEDRMICDAEAFDGADDYRFFYLGEDLEMIRKDKLYFPEFSHA